MISINFLENLFKLYLDNDMFWRKNASLSKELSCFTKYRKSLPENYIYSYPNSVVLKITEACNLRCKHCFFANNPDYYNKMFELETSEIKQLIDILTEDINIIAITLTGGEVFVKKDFLEILKYIKQKKLITTIQTNGVLIDNKKVQALKNILNKKTDSIQISLDGVDKISHEKIRGIGTFDETINAIKLLRENNIRVQINTTLTTISAPNMDKMFELCQELGVKLLSVSKYEVCSEEQKYLQLSASELMEYSNLLLEKAKQFKEVKMKYNALTVMDFLRFPEGRILLDNYLANNDIKISTNKCLACHMHDKITISSQGNVFLCSMDESKKAILGNLREKSFYEIWENRFNTPYFQKRDITTTKCKNCKYIALCGTGCMASAYKKYGDINCAPAECSYFEEYLRGQNE